MASVNTMHTGLSANAAWQSKCVKGLGTIFSAMKLVGVTCRGGSDESIMLRQQSIGKEVQQFEL